MAEQLTLNRYWHEKSGIFSPAQLKSLQKTSLAKVLCENGDRIDRIPRNVFLNGMYPRDYVPCSTIEDVDLEPWRGCCKQNMAGPNASMEEFSVGILSTRCIFA